MKMVMRVVCGCGLTVALVLFSVNAWAYFEDSLVDSFEFYNAGDLNDQKGWTVSQNPSPPPPSYVNIVTANAPGHGSQAIQFGAGVESVTEADKNYNFSFSPEDYITFHVNPSFTGNNNNFEVNIITSDNPHSIIAGLKFKYDAANSNYGLYAYNGTDWTSSPITTISYTSGWAEYSFKFIYNGKYRIRRDGSNIGNAVDLGVGGTLSDATTLQLTTPTGWGTGNAQFDAVYVNPEPATVFMMLMGLGLFYRKRRLFSV